MFELKITSYLKVTLILIFILQLTLNKVAISFTYRYNSIVLLSLLLLAILTFTQDRFESNKRLFLYFFLWLIISAIYFFLLSVFRGFGWFTYITIFRNSIQYYIVILVVALIKDVTDLKFTVIYSIMLFCLFESIVGLGQLLHLDFVLYISELKPYFMGDRLVNVDNYSTGVNLPHGTLERYSVYGNTLSVMAVYLVSIYSYIRKTIINFKLYFFTIFISLVMVFMSGNRIALIGTLLALLTILFISNLRLFFIYFTIIVCVVLVLKTTIFTLGGEHGKTLSFDNPLTRHLAVFSLVTEDKGKGVSTFLLNSYMFEQASKSVLTGVGYFQKTSGYDGIITKHTDNFTDVMMLWLIAEFGIIGFCLYFSPVFYILKLTHNHPHNETKLVVYPLFVCVFTQTITDPGLFDPSTGFIFLLLVSLHVFSIYQDQDSLA